MGKIYDFVKTGGRPVLKDTGSPFIKSQSDQNCFISAA